MAYSTSNPPIADDDALGSGAVRWTYRSADTAATVAGANYFSNGDDLGMDVGDMVFILDTTTPKATVSIVSAVTAGGAATVTL